MVSIATCRPTNPSERANLEAAPNERGNRGERRPATDLIIFIPRAPTCAFHAPFHSANQLNAFSEPLALLYIIDAIGAVNSYPLH